MKPQTDPIEAAFEDVQLTLEELASVCAVSREWLVERIESGLLQASGAGPCFDAATLRRVRTMRSIELTFDAAPELAALVADLTDEIARLRLLLRGTDVR